MSKKYTLPELEELLEEKQKKFCCKYIEDWQKARSYMYAYPDTTYQAAAVSAHHLLKKDEIKQYIAAIQVDIQKEAGISKIKQIKALMKIIEDPEANNRDRISAVAELNKMLGFNSPDKLEVSAVQHIINLGEGEEPK
jgi:phage terminase small subunit